MFQRAPLHSIATIILGNGLLALAYAKWMVPHTIINGGVTRLSLVVQKIIPVDLSFITNSLTVILLIFCGVFLGKNYLMKSIIGSLIYMGFFSLFYFLPFQLLFWLAIDFLLSCFVIALGYYCCFSENSKTVGVDVIALIIHQKKPEISIANMIRNLNIIVLLFRFMTYGLQPVLIGFLFTIVYTWILDKMLSVNPLKGNKIKEISEN